MVLPADIKELIGRLDPGSLTAFVEALLGAEVTRLGMPANSLVMSDAITENDEGLDALLNGVSASPAGGPESALPTGEVGMQLKATRKKDPSAFGLDKELRKPGPRRLLKSGGAYVLVSAQDFNPAQRQAMEALLAEEAGKVLEEDGVGNVMPRVFVWDAQTLALVCQIHPSVAVDIGLADFGQAQSLPELLESLRASERQFQSDSARENAVARLRERAAATLEDPLLMTLHGEPGAGKTRTVAHALDTDELRDLVLYVNGTEGLQVLLTRLIRMPASRGILFADEIDEHETADTCRRLGGLHGRWRVVSVTSRTDPRSIAEGGRNIVLPPLDPDATRRLVEQHSGLPEQLARMVAEVAAGFPELALRLADELKADPHLDLVRLARLPHPSEVLQRALQDDELRRSLAPIALFTAVGFEEELRSELEAVAEVFDLDADQIERHCQSELDRRRFVSRAGRYRMISPLLVAIWLATDLIERTPRFEERVLALPESLQEAFVRQLDYFGPDAPHLPAALRRVIGDERFRRPQAFSEAAGRFLRASAAIVPTQVAEAISELLASASADDLLRIPRRDLVWALQILLWWPETWEPAVESLYLLAQQETETWANNATNEFPAAFSLYLSGSTVPYADRAAWLRRRMEEANDSQQLTLLANAAAAGLQVHHVRARVGFQGGGEPTDWQPQTAEEYMDARRTAWRLLLFVRDRVEEEHVLGITKQLASSLRVLYQSGLEEEIAVDIRNRSWSFEERTVLASGLRDVVQYEELEAEARARVEALHDSLVGDDLEGRLQIILGTALWDLHTDRDTIQDPPPLLMELADQLAGRGADGLRVALEAGSDAMQPETRHVLFRLLGERLGAAIVGGAGRTLGDWPAVAAALSVADAVDEGEWATGLLIDLAESDPERVTELLSFVDLSPERLEIALSLVEGGRASGGGLGRLLYGARIKTLDEQHAIRVLQAVRASGNLEAALGMMDQWVDEHEERSDAVREIAATLALEAASGEGGTMTDFYVQRLIETNTIPHPDVMQVWKARMMNRKGLVGQLDRALTDRVLSDPGSASPLVLDLVRTRRVTFGLFSSKDLPLLSRLAAATSPEGVWSEMRKWSEAELRWGLHYMNWSGSEPDPLVREFLVSERLGELEGEARVCFFNTLGGVVGPFYLALERELERARGWLKALTGTSAEPWAAKLVKGYEAEVALRRKQEEEEDLRFR